MDIEERIRSRIEAILINDARNDAEIKSMASTDEPVESDPFAEERNLYQRIINGYRSAVNRVNNLFEETIGFLSGFYKIVENIKEKNDLQEICMQIVDCLLQDLGAEYCGLFFMEGSPENSTALCLEGVHEDRKIVSINSSSRMLGSEELRQALIGLASGGSECSIIGDVYRETRFNQFDFPGVVRSLICLPIVLHKSPAGFLVLGNSLPNYFNENHIRVLKIVTGMLALVRSLTALQNPSYVGSPAVSIAGTEEPKDRFLSIVLLDFESSDAQGVRCSLEREALRAIRNRLHSALQGKGHVLFHDDRKLLVLLPGVSAEMLSPTIFTIQESFQQWKSTQGEKFAAAHMNLGFSTCEEDDDLTRTLDVAGLLTQMSPESDRGIGTLI
jgi:hypothetical protein